MQMYYFGRTYLFMEVNIAQSWKKILEPEFQKNYFKQLTSEVREAYLSGPVFPPQTEVFNAFDLCPLKDLKVVILGQDPYHGEDQAHGLSFSVKDGIRTPPSLKNMYKEIHADLGKDIPESGNLERWAKQGVLLLNATLTVLPGQPGSHQGKGWEEFTDATIEAISKEKEHVVFLLWGNFARSKASLIDNKKHLILEAPHPSPLSAHRGFLGCKHFSKANGYLKSHSIKEIEW